ncbi:hypothetical protein CORC01_04840 [Colletotrichum orchidophilum]|uniref:C2H2-type domain-containing protein n=1 Tax=Colletotrichum orchidophilum TaxID=1209926 RepID=A0A1G4BEN3_9PEZI|nr:uncharacterized protein CORC01_04840 [Colletotrichum orchidophilum]OHE99939.1 hypothetical protein CORC01_04840 [Colletotrichum orchidophilum]
MPRAIPDRCPARFADKRDLERHHNTTHLRIDGGYECPDCGTKLERSDHLSRHLKKPCKKTRVGR